MISSVLNKEEQRDLFKNRQGRLVINVSEWWGKWRKQVICQTQGGSCCSAPLLHSYPKQSNVWLVTQQLHDRQEQILIRLLCQKQAARTSKWEQPGRKSVIIKWCSVTYFILFLLLKGQEVSHLSESCHLGV